ncbi:MAG: RMD1 family protein [Vallitaleaceae bacterium]|nr:RMD1 family protein [Vallitaleaceae bacterium]
MNDVLFTSVLISESLPLEKISNFFKIHKALKWKDYIVITQYHLEMILRYNVEGKSAYIYDFGAITFVNMHTAEIKVFLDYLESIVGLLDYNLFMNSCEAHTIRMLPDNQCYLCKWSEAPTKFEPYIIPITAEILAQSVAMERIEAVLTQLLNESELMLKHLSRGRLKGRSRKISRITTKIIKFQYDSIKSIHIFDRPKFSNASLLPKEVHEELFEFYELYDRFHIIETKSHDLLNIYSNYTNLGEKKVEHRLYILQAVLLFLFPLKYLIGDQIKVAIVYTMKFISKLMELV